TTFAYRQLQTMRGQLAEMRSSSEQTAATIAVLRDQADALKKQMDLMRESNRINEAASTSNLRAWIEPASFTPNVDLETAAFPDLQVGVVNVGRQPAEHVAFDLHLDYGEMSETKDANPDTFPVWTKHADELAWEHACQRAVPSLGTPLVY